MTSVWKNVYIDKLDNIVKNDHNMRKNWWNVLQKGIAKSKSKRTRTEKRIKRKDEKLYVKWKGYNISFNIWINRKDII